MKRYRTSFGPTVKETEKGGLVEDPRSLH